MKNGGLYFSILYYLRLVVVAHFTLHFFFIPVTSSHVASPSRAYLALSFSTSRFSNATCLALTCLGSRLHATHNTTLCITHYASPAPTLSLLLSSFPPSSYLLYLLPHDVRPPATPSFLHPSIPPFSDVPYPIPLLFVIP